MPNSPWMPACERSDIYQETFSDTLSATGVVSWVQRPLLGLPKFFRSCQNQLLLFLSNCCLIWTTIYRSIIFIRLMRYSSGYLSIIRIACVYFTNIKLTTFERTFIVVKIDESPAIIK